LNESVAFRSEIEPSGGSKEDEMYEANAEATIKSYKLEVLFLCYVTKIINHMYFTISSAKCYIHNII